MPTQHVLPPLPYPLDALAPVISRATMEVHYDKHHRGYVERVNKLVAGTNKASLSLDDVITKSTGPLAHAAAQAWNHDFFWRSMTPRKTQPSAAVASALVHAFGSLEAFEERWKTAAKDLFGSGWVWLIRSKTGALEIVTTPNAGLLVHETAAVPLMTLDVWEHAYYLDYKNERARYVEGAWGLINWDFVAERLGRVSSGTSAVPDPSVGRFASETG